MSISVF